MVDRWLDFDLDFLEDPEFDLDDFQLRNGELTALGSIDSSQSRSWRKYWRRTAGMPEGAKDNSRLSVRFSVQEVERYEIEDEAQIGVLMLERIVHAGDRVELVGVIPCRVTVWTRSPQSARLELEFRV